MGLILLATYVHDQSATTLFKDFALDLEFNVAPFEHSILLPESPEGASARCLAVEPMANILHGVLIETGVEAARGVADVWRGQ